ncbi:MAG: DMT family transporter [Bacteroidota bacterium]|jgi:drug/metabolite transporter (DMT)-like permease
MADQRTTNSDGRASALAYLAVLIFAWGGNYTWMKMALADIGPWAMNFARYALGIGLIATALIFAGRTRELIPVRGERIELACIGFLQAAVITGATAVALQWIEATRTVLIAYTVPIWTMIFSLLVLRERPTRAGVAGTLVGLAGLAVLTNPHAMQWNAATIPGTFAALIGAIGWSLGSVLYRRRPWRSTFWQQVFWQLATTTLATGVGWFVLERGHSIRPTATLGVLIVYMAAAPTVIGYWCWSQALSRLSASAASQVLLLSPVFGMLQSHIVLGEPLSPALLAAALCIVAGAWITLAARPRRA